MGKNDEKNKRGKRKMKEYVNFKEEEICGFRVSEKRKKVWNEELAILETIVNVCNKYNINYSMAGGTLLGIVRHNGYIPWDDDIDIAMKRNEYEKFLKFYKKENTGYFLQCSDTENAYIRGHAQIRNSDTTAIILGDQYNDYNKGIFVDIFPLDNVPDDTRKRTKFISKNKKQKKFLSFYFYKNSKNIFKKIFKYCLWKMPFLNINNEIKKFEKNAQIYNLQNTKKCYTVTFGCDKFCYDNEWFNRLIERDFYTIKVKIFKDYDLALKRQYGNYIEIPKNKNGSIHGQVFFDCDKSYKYYLPKINEIEEKIINKEIVL